ncbi:glycosyltransferase family 2 protein [Amnibacterium sp. CER49]|uniref:glycosyltransferase family 2 protein n=1 Tax=Amnibacterium sp. CER49 TaxID=3039161 RepID=UPI00244D3C1C|nr:glycosyltransferase family 2 protein [Amnibacterium sp. CER49]MDH2443076.1 glycosyltransferase family 2 protein [Amnibacterium sp. CER49]
MTGNEASGSGIRISVIVAAYRPGDGITRVIDSLDAQTLPQDEFETIVIDDGSPDDTYERLQRYAETRPNMRVHRIENSGWPSRPRNVATEMARGEWVLFMDHDDSLYPDALRRVAEYAAETGADLLSPKESKTSDVWWGVNALSDGNLPNVLGSGGGIDRLLPMVPHKFYRRAFLAEHGIRFPEGRRMLWEDIYVNVEAWRHARVVSVLADAPVYLWHSSETNNSKTYGPQTGEFWDRLDQLFAFIDETLDGPEFAEARRTMLLHQYRGRLIGRFGQMLSYASPEEVRRALARGRALQERYIPEEWDGLLGRFERARALLLRAERPDLLRVLVQGDADLHAVTRADRIEWRDGRLHLSVSAGWRLRSEGPMPFERQGDRVLRVLPPAVAAALPAELLDVTDDLPSLDAWVGIRARSERVTWRLRHEPERLFEPVGDEGRVAPAVRTEVEVDLGTAASGHPLEDTVYDLYGAVRWGGLARSASIKYGKAARAALLDGRQAVAYKNKKGNLTLDLAGRLRSVVKDARPGEEHVHGADGRLTVELPEAVVHGTTALPAEVVLEPSSGGEAIVLPGHLVGDAEGARLEAAGSVPPGDYGLAFRTGAGGESLESAFRLTVDESGVMSAAGRNAPPPAQETLSDRLGAQLERTRKRLRTSAREMYWAIRRR